MGVPTRLRLIRRKSDKHEWYVNLPSAVARALDFQKGRWSSPCAKCEKTPLHLPSALIYAPP